MKESVELLYIYSSMEFSRCQLFDATLIIPKYLMRHRAPDWTRTSNTRLLRPLPLPIGVQEHNYLPYDFPPAAVHLSYAGRKADKCASG
jgi:hypothetical protein